MSAQVKSGREEFARNLQSGVLKLSEDLNSKATTSRLHIHPTSNDMKKFEEKPGRKRKHKKIKRPRAKKVAAILLVASLAASGAVFAASAKGDKDKLPETLEEAIQSGMTLEELGIDESIQSRLYGLREKVKSGNLTNQEIIQMAPEINEIIFDVPTSKLSRALGVKEKGISYKEEFNQGEKIQMVIAETGYSTEKYCNESIINTNNTFPQVISKEMEDMKIMQEIMQELQAGNFYREYVLNKYATILQDTEKLAASPLKRENNKIIIEKNRNRDKKTDSQQENATQNATPDQERG